MMPCCDRETREIRPNYREIRPILREPVKSGQY
jgi:hypothetical protein